MALPANVKNKKQGDIIRSDDWNVVTNEVDRLDSAKANLSGSIFTGPLAIQHNSGGALTNTQLQLTEIQADDYARLSFHNANVPTQTWNISGLLSATAGVIPRLNFWFNGKGDILSLYGDGKVEMLHGNLFFGARVAQHINLWTTEYGLGVQAGTTYFRTGGDFSWFVGGTHNDARGNPGAGGTRAMTLNGAGDLILCGRSNPTNDPAKSACRALVNWKASAAAPDELHINWSNDFAGGTHVGSGLHLANSDLYFTKTNHTHSGIGNAAGHAAIENASNFNSLMILGRMVGTLRRISMWDHLEMNGNAFKPGGGAWGSLSDEKLKKNIKPVSGALSKLLSLKGVNYEWKDPAKHGNLTGTQTGFIAQEVESVFPDWVGNDIDDLKTLSIRGFEALVVEALRDLKTEIDEIKANLGIKGKSVAKSPKN